MSTTYIYKDLHFYYNSSEIIDFELGSSFDIGINTAINHLECANRELRLDAVLKIFACCFEFKEFDNNCFLSLNSANIEYLL